jgi:hypothetical protein
MFVLEMFLTCVHEIPNPLSLCVKLHRLNNNNCMYQTMVIKVWAKLLIETKKLRIIINL